MKILMIEDDASIVETLSLGLQVQWPNAKLISTHLGGKGIEMLRAEEPDVIILDLGLPDMGGMEVLAGVRQFSQVPVVILTVRGEQRDITTGLEMGADDYMVKPFRIRELLARIRALARRQGRR